MLHRPTSSVIRRSAIGFALVAAMALPATASAAEVSAVAAPATAATAVCTDGHWPVSVDGRPRFHAGSRAGDRIWHDAAGWHLRVTHPGTRGVVFKGRIRSDTPLTVKGVRLEKQDRFTLSADKLTITYRFVNHGRVDGLDFRTDCASQLTFLGKIGTPNEIGTHKLSPARIWLGHYGRHPLENPFVVIRVS